MEKNLNHSLRLELLVLIERSGWGDIGLSLEILDILVALYLGEDNGERILNYDASKPQWEGRDYVVFSERDAGLSLNLVLKHAGFKIEDFLTESLTLKTPGVDAPISLQGHALTIGYGIAKALALDKKINRVYVILNDEDLMHGEVWEAAMHAAHDRLESLIVICSHHGSSKLDPIQEKFEAFGWKVFKLIDGHDVQKIVDGLGRAKSFQRRPSFILAPTVFGKGVPFVEGNTIYRRARFSQQEMKAALDSLQAQL